MPPPRLTPAKSFWDGAQKYHILISHKIRPRKINYITLIPFLVIILLNELCDHHTIIYNISYLLKGFHVLYTLFRSYKDALTNFIH